MAEDLNQVMLVGRLTRDAELRYTNSGYPVANFSLANTQRRKRGDEWTEEGHFFDCEMFGRRAESLSRYLVKGKQLGVHGQLRQDRWEQEGRTRSRVVISVNNIQLLGGRNDAPPREDPGAAPGAAPGARPAAAAPARGSGGIPPAEEFDDDIPF